LEEASLSPLSPCEAMAAAKLRFCARTLEQDVGFGAHFASHRPRLTGGLHSARWPSDLQRHEVNTRGEVLHLASLGFDSTRQVVTSSWDVQDGGRRASRSGRGDHNLHAKAGSSPWAATMYVNVHGGGTSGTATSSKLLATELGVSPNALRAPSELKIPGISVGTVRLPRGLARGFEHSPLSYAMHSGVIRSGSAVVAIGSTHSQPSFAEPQGPGSSSRRSPPQKEWQCDGHRYTMILRGLDATQCNEGLVDDAMDGLCENGFVNYFELATFGFAEVRRYEVGAALWQGQWHQAARLILTANVESWGALGAATAAFRKGDLAGGIELLPEDGAEGLHSLAYSLLRRRPALEALHDAVPVFMWARYLGAVAKLMWNHAATTRLSSRPHRAMDGDLVLEDGRARPLTVEEARGRPFSDVVLPLPRWGQELPECTSRLHMSSLMRRLLPEANLPVEENFPRGIHGWLPEARHLTVVPSDLSWDVVEGSDAAEAVLVECDLSRLGVKGIQVARTHGRRSQSRLRGPALRFRVTLPRGASAEAVLREVLHMNPSEFEFGLGRRDDIF